VEVVRAVRQYRRCTEAGWWRGSQIEAPIVNGVAETRELDDLIHDETHNDGGGEWRRDDV
jgi:ABC-type cobalamin transport system ATPase subunit